MSGEGRKFRAQTNAQKSADIARLLRKSWYRLRLSVRDPSRVPTWDAIILTAASPQQAHLYTWQLRRAKRLGLIAASSVTLVVPDPHGGRIGSGAATLNAICRLFSRYSEMSTSLAISSGGEKLEFSESSDDRSLFDHVDLSIIDLMAKKHVLLFHAGGDSKRLPWANPMGKVFIPIPYLAADDPDGPVPLLFDHILAISSSARQAFKNKGGLFIMTGDVLLCFDASSLVLPEDVPCIITVPITLDIACNHGVIVASREGIADEFFQISRVENVLQKPSPEELIKSQSILDDGRTLLDTGCIAVRGTSWLDLIKISCSGEPFIDDLLRTKEEMSLYEDIVSAWVPAKHKWLRTRPFGETLIRGLGAQRMFGYCAYDLLFIHFGTSSEVLGHLSGTTSELVARRHLSTLPATSLSDISPSSIILLSRISSGVSIGEDSLIYGSTISNGVRVGSQSIVIGVKVPELNTDSPGFVIPDRHCLWEVPLVGSTKRVIVYCGIYDDPKHTLSSTGGTFCGKPWNKFFGDTGIRECQLWDEGVEGRCLWNAKIFPVLSYSEMITLGTWIMGSGKHMKESPLSMWVSAERVSLEELHRSIDFEKICVESCEKESDMAASIAEACIEYGFMGRNLSRLCDLILQKGESGYIVCEKLRRMSENLCVGSSLVIPRSRAYQIQLDFLHRDGTVADKLERDVWGAVADETSAWVRYDIKEHQMLARPHNTNDGDAYACVVRNISNRRARLELPVRVDFAGGWSDSPPWSLERMGCVLNMAIRLSDSLPVGASVGTTSQTGVTMTDDSGNQAYISDISSIDTPFGSDDPFRLVKCALIVTGLTYQGAFTGSGLEIETWARVPRGSGLGTSSILAAAVVKCLLQVVNGDVREINVARLVLVVEQMMGTGGGWQDQIGGLYPGIKYTISFPGMPLRLQVVPLHSSAKLVMELQSRMLVVFTGQVRLANVVLRKVVTRYLRRDNLLICSIRRLAELAEAGREALMNSDLDGLGEIMAEAWELHQELDPHCSNLTVDDLFRSAAPFCCGYKLVGAGGGGFALLLARDSRNAALLRRLLEPDPRFQVHDWQLSLS